MIIISDYATNADQSYEFFREKSLLYFIIEGYHQLISRWRSQLETVDFNGKHNLPHTQQQPKKSLRVEQAKMIINQIM